MQAAKMLVPGFGTDALHIITILITYNLRKAMFLRVDENFMRILE